MQIINRPLWTQSETINWIAFGDAVGGDLTGRGHWFEWRTDSDAADGMIRALRAVANGTSLWTAPPYPKHTPAWLAASWEQPPSEFVRLESCARALAVATGRAPTELANELEGRLTIYQNRCAAFRDAESALAHAIAGSRISEASAPRLHPYVEFPVDTLWYRKSDVLALWPETRGASADRTKPTSDDRPNKTPTAQARSAFPANSVWPLNGPGAPQRVMPGVIDKMQKDLTSGTLTASALAKLKQKELVERYGAARETVKKARDQVLSVRSTNTDN